MLASAPRALPAALAARHLVAGVVACAVVCGLLPAAPAAAVTTETPAAAAAAPAPTVVYGDWDGDGHDTAATFSAGRWTFHRSADASDAPYQVLSYGAAGDVPVVGDWDGDGRDSHGVWRAGVWWLRDDVAAGVTSRRFTWGLAGDVPVVGDWDGDGRDEPGAYRRGTWWLRDDAAAGPAWRRVAYGGDPRDVPVAGRVTAGADGIGVYRAGEWHLRARVTHGGTARRFRYGLPGDRPLLTAWDGTGSDTPTIVRDRGVWLHGHGPGPHYALAPGGGAAPAIDGQVLHGDWDGDGHEGLARYVNGRWTFHHTSDGADPAFLSTSFGYPGDVPVVGDWDGDGRDSFGVWRRGTWFLRPRVAAAGAVTRFGYGQPGDVPVTGDFDGDGDDDVGAVRHGTWYLRDDASAGRTWARFAWGLPDDVPVTGRWRRGARADGIGVYRRGRWYLSHSASAPVVAQRLTFGAASATPIVGDWRARGADTVGVVDRGVAAVLWQHTTPPAGWADQRFAIAGVTRRTPPPPSASTQPCPHADRTSAVAAADLVAQVQPPLGLDGPAPRGDNSDLLQTAFGNGLRHLLSSHYEAHYRAVAGQPYARLHRGANAEVEVRGPAMEALALATALRTGAYRDTDVGRPAAFAADHAAWLVRSLACQHRANASGGWGGGWQTAYWAALTGTAGWLLWDRLPAHDRAYVARMVESEAERAYPVSTWKDAAGRELHPGDTKAEELAWNATVVALASAMLPDDPRAAAWRSKAAQLMAASYAGPDDGDTVVNGRPLSQWADGWNVDADYTVVNHGRVHPDYAACISLNWFSALLYALAGQEAPEAAFHNGSEVYGALSTRDFTTPPHRAPGGAVYKPDAGRIYYPDGGDWSDDRVIVYASWDGMAAALGMDGLSTQPAASWERLHLAALLADQARSSDGRAYLFPGEDVYRLRDPYVPQHLASSWLAHYVAADGAVTVSAEAL